jgi:hypothetical protein
VVGDVVRHAAEQVAAGARHPLVADHDQIGPGLFGDVEDRVGRIGLDRVRLDLDPRLLRVGGGSVEDEVDVLARPDLVLDVGRRLGQLRFDPATGGGLVGADDAERAAGQVSEPSVPTTIRLNTPPPSLADGASLTAPGGGFVLPGRQAAEAVAEDFGRGFDQADDRDRHRRD